MRRFASLLPLLALAVGLGASPSAEAGPVTIVVGAPAFADRVWVPGHFERAGPALVWVPGHYKLVAPRPLAVPGHWELRHGRRVWVPHVRP